LIAFLQFSLVNNQTYRFHQNRYQSTDFGRLNSYNIFNKKIILLKDLFLSSISYKKEMIEESK